MILSNESNIWACHFKIFSSGTVNKFKLNLRKLTYIGAFIFVNGSIRVLRETATGNQLWKLGYNVEKKSMSTGISFFDGQTKLGWSKQIVQVYRETLAVSVLETINIKSNYWVRPLLNHVLYIFHLWFSYSFCGRIQNENNNENVWVKFNYFKEISVNDIINRKVFDRPQFLQTYLLY